MNTSNTVQELRDKHLEAIFDRLTSNGTESFVSTKVPKAAESCTQVSIQFAIDMMEDLKQKIVARRNEAHIYCMEDRKESYNDCINNIESQLTGLKQKFNQ